MHFLSSTSSHKQIFQLKKSTAVSWRFNQIITITIGLIMAALIILTSGCSTTHEFRPTATVMVGAHKSL